MDLLINLNGFSTSQQYAANPSDISWLSIVNFMTFMRVYDEKICAKQPVLRRRLYHKTGNNKKFVDDVMLRVLAKI